MLGMCKCATVKGKMYKHRLGKYMKEMVSDLFGRARIQALAFKKQTETQGPDK